MMVEKTDVLVVGGGPVGLLVALGLAQQGVDTLVIEKRELDVQETFGRACTLYPRTMELLEQLDVSSDITQAAFIGRTSAAFKDGKRINRPAYQSIFSLLDQSFHNYIVNIRQNSSQRIFAARYKADFNKSVQYGWELVSQEIDQSRGDGHNVTAVLSHISKGQRTVRCKYLVGADGGQSTVRRNAEIEMKGDETTYRWIRIDGRIKTTMPETDVAFGVLETPEHGSVLWVKLDKDAYRIGFALSPRLQAKYPDGLTQQDAINEAMACFRPFDLEIERLDWWTHYTIKQKVATALQKDTYILLAGDAAHTHSSAFAQGMNTGVHDATNLIWKLAGTLKGWYKPEVLPTYATERRCAAQKLIDIDRLAAAFVSGDIPANLAGLGATPEDALQAVMQKNMSFNIGLGVSYDAGLLNQSIEVTNLKTGMRSADATLYAPGPAIPVRLHAITHKENRGRWNIIVFAGYYYLTKDKVTRLREQITADESKFNAWAPSLTTSTIIVGRVNSAWEAFDGPAIGRLYFDTESQAHSRYGIYNSSGAIVVVRPDGIVAYAAGLDQLDKVEAFFEPILQ